MKTLTRLVRLEGTSNIPLELTSDIVDGKELDTRVEVKRTGTLCWVSGEQKDEFLKELNAVIEKYRI